MFTISIPIYKYKKVFPQTLKALEKLDQNLIQEINCYIEPTEDVELILSKIHNTSLNINIFLNDSVKGMVNNWNQCIQNCSSDYLIINHDDDILLPGILDKYRKIDNEYPEIALISSEQKIKGYPIKNFIKSLFYFKDSINYYDKGEISKFIQNDFTLPCSSVAFNLKLLKDNYLFSNSYSYSADEELWPRILKNFPIVKVKSPLIIRTLNDENHEFDTWNEPDFIKQYLLIRKDIFIYSNRNMDVFNYLYNKLTPTFKHIEDISGININYSKWLNYFKKICNIKF
ncbi:glycosyltransferase family A protein [Halanaerobium kushneri]|uniref:Glycosyl transferase family 2 n=1 Tax=Halanaerobium kushneri TaxID=56779 RepID=A0A1N7B6C3_9FIRM|nr:glycosyltransferase family A protein [Halanaerobium kushneri]SIR46852.1 Glycosyl transferase family 2 [Halanaerobium kushneri]